MTQAAREPPPRPPPPEPSSTSPPRRRARQLHDAFGDARAEALLTDHALDAALRRAPTNHPGAAIVRSILSEGGTHDRSKAERVVRQLCRDAQLAQPLVNRPLHGYRADFLWPDANLILEVDGYLTHGNRHAFESDRKRDQTHIAAGYVGIRVTWLQLQNEPLAAPRKARPGDGPPRGVTAPYESPSNATVLPFTNPSPATSSSNTPDGTAASVVMTIAARPRLAPVAAGAPPRRRRC